MDLSKFYKKYDDSNINIVPEYIYNYKNYPIKENIVSVGYNSISSDGSSVNYTGSFQNQEFFSNSLNIIISADIFVPVSKSGSECYKIFSKLAEFFIFNSGNQNYKASKISSGKISYISTIQAFTVSAQVYIGSDISFTDDSGQVYSDISVIRK